MQNDQIRRSLDPTYKGSFKVISRSDKVFTIEINSQPQSVSINRLKAANLLNCTDESVINHDRSMSQQAIDPSQSQNSNSQTSSPASPQYNPVRHSTTGRMIKSPLYYYNQF